MKYLNSQKDKYYTRFPMDKYFSWFQREYVRNKGKSMITNDYEVNKYYLWFIQEIETPFYKNDLSIILNSYFNYKLSDREKFILIHHYGLFYNKELSIREMALIFDLSEKRIKQIKEQALRRLRKSINYKGDILI